MLNETALLNTILFILIRLKKVYIAIIEGMFHYLGQKPKKQHAADAQQNLFTIKQQLFQFSLGSNACKKNDLRITFRNSKKMERRKHQKEFQSPGFIHCPPKAEIQVKNSINDLARKERIVTESNISFSDEEIRASQREGQKFQSGQKWKPKLGHKKIYEDPMFLLSIQRKRSKGLNAVSDSQFSQSHIQRFQLKTSKLKNRKQILIERQKVLSTGHKTDDNYTHASLNLNSDASRNSRTPFLNFNLHHLIKEKKQLENDKRSSTNEKRRKNNYSTTFNNDRYKEVQETQYPGKKGTNYPYYVLLKSDKFEKGNRIKNFQVSSLEDPVPLENEQIIAKVSTAKSNQNESKHIRINKTVQAKRTFSQLRYI